MIKGYYFITDESLSKAGNISDVRSAVEAGVKVVQYRNKAASTNQLYEEALYLRKICAGISFLINDRIDIALAVDADGVHIGQDDLPLKIARELLGADKIIGLTIHNENEAILAQELGADYIGVSPIFQTGTKPDAGKPSGVELIAKVKKLVKLPIVAIGGINMSNAKQVIDAGADSLCSISAVVASTNPREEILRIQNLFGGRK